MPIFQLAIQIYKKYFKFANDTLLFLLFLIYKVWLCNLNFTFCVIKIGFD